MAAATQDQATQKTLSDDLAKLEVQAKSQDATAKTTGGDPNPPADPGRPGYKTTQGSKQIKKGIDDLTGAIKGDMAPAGSSPAPSGSSTSGGFSDALEKASNLLSEMKSSGPSGSLSGGTTGGGGDSGFMATLQGLGAAAMPPKSPGLQSGPSANDAGGFFQPETNAQGVGQGFGITGAYPRATDANTLSGASQLVGKFLGGS